jgi:hypothetical protein
MSKKITELPAASSVNDADLSVVVQSGVTKQATSALMRSSGSNLGTASPIFKDVTAGTLRHRTLRVAGQKSSETDPVGYDGEIHVRPSPPGHFNVCDFGAVADWGGTRTGTTTIGSNQLVVNTASGLVLGQPICIEGVTGTFTILAIVGTTITLSSTAGAAVSGASVYTDNLPAFNACLASMRATVFKTNKLICDGHFYLSGRLYIGQCVVLVGTGRNSATVGSAGRSSPGTWLVFPTNTDGLYIDAGIVSGNGAAGTHLTGLTIWCKYTRGTAKFPNTACVPPGGHTGHGIHATAQFSAHDVFVENFAEHGVFMNVVATTADPTEIGNLSGSHLSKVMAAGCGGDGFHVRGADAGENVFTACESAINWGWGVWDQGGGSHWSTHLCQANLGEPSVPAWSATQTGSITIGSLTLTITAGGTTGLVPTSYIWIEGLINPYQISTVVGSTVTLVDHTAYGFSLPEATLTNARIAWAGGGYHQDLYNHDYKSGGPAFSPTAALFSACYTEFAANELNGSSMAIGGTLGSGLGHAGATRTGFSLNGGIANDAPLGYQDCAASSGIRTEIGQPDAAYDCFVFSTFGITSATNFIRYHNQTGIGQGWFTWATSQFGDGDVIRVPSTNAVGRNSERAPWMPRGLLIGGGGLLDTAQLHLAGTSPSTIYDYGSSSGRTYEIGDIVWQSAPTASGPLGSRCLTAGTLDTLTGVTGSITTGLTALVVNDTSRLVVGHYITIVGVTGVKKITNITGFTVTIDSVSDATVVGAAVAYSAAVFETFGTATPTRRINSTTTTATASQVIESGSTSEGIDFTLHTDAVTVVTDRFTVHKNSTADGGSVTVESTWVRNGVAAPVQIGTSNITYNLSGDTLIATTVAHVINGNCIELQASPQSADTLYWRGLRTQLTGIH